MRTADRGARTVGRAAMRYRRSGALDDLLSDLGFVARGLDGRDPGLETGSARSVCRDFRDPHANGRRLADARLVETLPHDMHQPLAAERLLEQHDARVEHAVL